MRYTLYYGVEGATFSINEERTHRYHAKVQFFRISGDNNKPKPTGSVECTFPGLEKAQGWIEEQEELFHEDLISQPELEKLVVQKLGGDYL